MANIPVRDGMQVRTGDLLLHLDETQLRANAQVLSQQLDQIRVRVARLITERDGLDQPEMPHEMANRSGDGDVSRLWASEISLFNSRAATRRNAKELLQSHVGQLGEQISGLDAQVKSKAAQHDLISGELEGVDGLYQKGLVPLTCKTSLQREAARLDGERGQVVAAIAEAKSKISEAELQAVKIDHDFRTEVMKGGGPTAVDHHGDPLRAGPAAAPTSTRSATSALPGEAPFTRGIHPTGYRSRARGRCACSRASARPRTRTRGSASCSRAGQTGLSIAYDMPTLYGYDTDDPEAEGEFGTCGVAVSQPRRHGGPARRPAAGQRLDVDDDQLAGGADLGDVHRRGREGRLAAGRARGHDPERHPQGVRRPEGVPVPARAVDAPRDRHDRVRDARDAALEHGLDQRLPHPRGRLDRGPGARVHDRRRHGLRRGGDRARPARRRLRAPALVLLQLPQRLLRGDRQVPGLAPDLVEAHDASATGPRTSARPGCASTPRPPACRSRRSSRSTT